MTTIKILVRLFCLLLLISSLSSCNVLKRTFGFRDSLVDFPPGEYSGFAKIIDDTEAPVPAVEPAPAKPLPDSPKAPEITADKNGQTTNGAPAIISMSDILQEPEIDPKAKAIKLTFLPREEGLTDAVGVLTLENDSQKFSWRCEGNNKDTWNLEFVKDNNVYSAIHTVFNFTGVAFVNDFENKINGRLYLDRDGKNARYSVEVYQYFPPNIVPPKDALSIKAGDPIELEVAKTGIDSSIIKAYMLGGEKKELKEVEVQKIEKDPKKGNLKIFLTTDKAASKGDYNLFLVRSKRFKSNLLPFKIQ